jgi:hypothetical protein
VSVLADVRESDHLRAGRRVCGTSRFVLSRRN